MLKTIKKKYYDDTMDIIVKYGKIIEEYSSTGKDGKKRTYRKNLFGDRELIISLVIMIYCQWQYSVSKRL